MIPNNVINLVTRFLGKNINMPNINTPDEMAQFLLNTGRVDQNLVNKAKQMWSNPQIQQQINNQYK